jgi:hypothetical protein
MSENGYETELEGSKSSAEKGQNKEKPKKSNLANNKGTANSVAMERFLARMESATIPDFEESFVRAYHAKVNSGVVCQMGKVALVAEPEALLGVLGYYQKQEIDTLVQIKEFDIQTARFQLAEVERPECTFTSSRHTLQFMGAVQICMTTGFEDDADAWPIPGVSPKGVSMRMSVDGDVMIFTVGSSGGDLVQVPIPVSVSRVAAQEERMVPAVHHGDPMKQRIRDIPDAAVKLLLGNKFDSGKFNSRGFMDVYSAFAGGGLEAHSLSDVADCPELLVGLSRENCLHLLCFRVIDLWYFRLLPIGSNIYDSKHHTAVCTEEEKRGMTVDEVGECFENVRRAFHCVFFVGPAWNGKFIRVWPDMQRVKIKCKRSRPLLGLGWVQLELLNRLLSRFLAAVTYVEVTEEMVQQELELFRIDEDDKWFRDLYAAIDREHTQELLTGVVHQRDRGGDDHLNKKICLNVDNNKPVIAPKDKRKKMYCFAFLSAAGCDRQGCRFSHKSVSGLPQAEKEKLKASLQEKGLVPNPSKF